MHYRGEIDGLRTLAVVPVILFHAGIRTFSGGFVGVDVFFVISGYLITSILISELQSGTFSILKFYERRARRIQPALFAVMFVSLPFAWFLLPPGDMESFAQSLVAVSLFSSNFLFWHQAGYFDTATELKPLIHTWSLAVEEQFYLFFPLLLLLTWRFGKSRVLWIMAAVSSLSLLTAHYGARHFPGFAYFLLPTRAWELAIGASIAFYYSEHNIKRHNRWVAQWGSLIGLLLVAYSVFAFDKETPFPGVYALVPTLGAALIIVFATHETWVGRLLGSKPFVGLGLLSYSAYLWHQPIFSFARFGILDESQDTMLMLCLAVISVVLGYLSWRFIERPFRNRHRFTRQQIFLYGAICSAIFVVIGLAGHLSNGWAKYRFSASHLSLLATAQSSPKRNACHTGGETYLRPENSCKYFGTKNTWAVLGDSHAVELAYALASNLSRYDIAVSHLSFSACPPSFETHEPRPACARWTDEAVDYLDRTPGIKTVVVSYRLNQHLFGKHDNYYPGLANEVSTPTRSEIWASYIRLIRQLRDSGKQVIVVLQAPEVRKRIGDLIFRTSGKPGDIVGVPVSWWERRNAFVMSHVNDIPSGVTVINPATLFCDDLDCHATSQGISLYFDSDHMSVAGADVVAKRVIGSVVKIE